MTSQIKQQRTCIGCGLTDHLKNFIRIKFDGKKIIISDGDKKNEGRGAHICPDEKCLQKAIKRNAFSYRLKEKIPAAVISDFSKNFLQTINKKNYQ